METKQCSSCGETKLRDAFNRLTRAKDGLQFYCRDCTRARARSEKEQERARERAREWYANNTERSRTASKAWRKAHPEKFAEYSRQWRARNPEKRRAVWIKSRYKLSQEQYEELLKHHGICDSCGEEAAKHIDHDHTTGKYRGQLCQGCNQAAGCLKDDPDRAMALAAYLVRVKEATDG